MDACKNCPYKIACIFDPGNPCFLDDIPHFFQNIERGTYVAVEDTDRNSHA